MGIVLFSQPTHSLQGARGGGHYTETTLGDLVKSYSFLYHSTNLQLQEFNYAERRLECIEPTRLHA